MPPSGLNRVIMDSVHGICPVDRPLRRILDTQEVQRLRFIHQTGLNFLVYPGSEHSRFVHSLGTYSVAKRIFQHLYLLSSEMSDLSPSKLDGGLEKAFLVGALCHDLGHTAFSHTLENVLLPEGFKTHEDCTLHLMQRDGPIANEIKEYGCEIDEVVQLLSGRHWVDGLCRLLSGNIDVDRWDYLLRDSRAAGVRYGVFDLNWLINSISLQADSTKCQRLVLDARRGLSALKQFLRARAFMYEQVYLHATVRGADRLLRAMFERAADTAKPGRFSDHKNRAIPKIFEEVAAGKRASLEHFLLIDDIAVIGLVKVWANLSRDPVLRYLARCFLKRRLFKEVGSWRSEVPPGYLELVKNAVRKAFKKQVSDDLKLKDEEMEQSLDYFVLIDTATFKADDRFDGILFDIGGGTLVTLEELRQNPEFNPPLPEPPFHRVRLFVPYEVRGAVLSDAAAN